MNYSCGAAPYGRVGQAFGRGAIVELFIQINPQLPHDGVAPRAKLAPRDRRELPPRDQRELPHDGMAPQLEL